MSLHWISQHRQVCTRRRECKVKGLVMTITENKITKIIGTRLLRREDPPLLTGEAKFTNDLNIPGALHLSVLRSPYAHAKIKSIDVSAALKIAGVIAIYTGKDLQSAWAAPRIHNS